MATTGHSTARGPTRGALEAPAQVLIPWCLEHDLVVIPKSVHEERIRENANVFDFSLSPEDLRRLDGLNEDLYTGWDPRDVP